MATNKQFILKMSYFARRSLTEGPAQPGETHDVIPLLALMHKAEAAGIQLDAVFPSTSRSGRPLTAIQSRIGSFLGKAIAELGTGSVWHGRPHKGGFGEHRSHRYIPTARVKDFIEILERNLGI